mgnify:FL=1
MIVNLNKKHIKDFTSEDTLYIRKIINGFDYNYLCQFISYKNGVVTAKILELDEARGQHPWQYKNKIITARPSKCFLWGKNANDKWTYCYWFKDGIAQ